MGGIGGFKAERDEVRSGSENDTWGWNTHLRRVQGRLVMRLLWESKPGLKTTVNYSVSVTQSSIASKLYERKSICFNL